MSRKLKFDREIGIKGLMAFLLIGGIISLVFSGLAYTKKAESVSATYRTDYVERGKFVHAGVFSDESVYKNGTRLQYYPSKITRAINGNYTYKITPSSRGYYEVNFHQDYYITASKKRISILNTTEEIAKGEFEGSFSIPASISLSKIDHELENVKDGTGLSRANVESYLTVKVSPENGEDFLQKISLVKDSSGMLRLEGDTKEYKKVERIAKTRENTIDFLLMNVRVSTARKVLPPLTAFLLIPPIGFMYIKRKPGEKDEMKALRKFIVEGNPETGGERVFLRSKEDLEKVFDLTDKPIVHHRRENGDTYTVIDGGVHYEYFTTE